MSCVPHPFISPRNGATGHSPARDIVELLVAEQQMCRPETLGAAIAIQGDAREGGGAASGWARRAGDVIRVGVECWRSSQRALMRIVLQHLG
jgi:hypothetical protein